MEWSEIEIDFLIYGSNEGRRKIERPDYEILKNETFILIYKIKK